MNCESSQIISSTLMGQSSQLEKRGRIFNIQRYSLNDGQGIRTVVFFKGCPLSCPWCSNPESRAFDVQLVKKQSRCIHCRECVLDRHDLSMDDKIEECPSGALEYLGKDMTVQEVLEEVEKDSVFYRTSGGGVTLSGGEVMAQAEFAIALAKELRTFGYPIAIETTGQCHLRHLLSIGKLCDEVLYDFKIMEAKRAKAVTGIDLSRVLSNFTALLEAGIKVIPRLPLIPGQTTDVLNVTRVLAFLEPFDIQEIHLLPFHQYGAGKYDNLNMAYAYSDVPTPSSDEIAAIKRWVESEGYRVVIGG